MSQHQSASYRVDGGGVIVMVAVGVALSLCGMAATLAWMAAK